MDVRENAIQALKRLPERPEIAQLDSKVGLPGRRADDLYHLEQDRASRDESRRGPTYQPTPSYRKARYRSSSPVNSQSSLATLPRYSHLKGLGLS